MLKITSKEHLHRCFTAGPQLIRRASQVTQWVKNPPAVQETQVRFLGQKDPLEEGMQPTPVFLPGESHGQRVCRATVHGVTKGWT